jgi:hypothetical protein
MHNLIFHILRIFYMIYFSVMQGGTVRSVRCDQVIKYQTYTWPCDANQVDGKTLNKVHPGITL